MSGSSLKDPKGIQMSQRVFHHFSVVKTFAESKLNAFSRMVLGR
jgi:hypothetical protein